MPARFAMTLGLSADQLLGQSESDALDYNFDLRITKRLRRIHELPQARKQALLKTIDAYLVAAKQSSSQSILQSEEGAVMPRMTVDLSVERLAQTIAELSEEERETLALLLSEHGEDLKRRKEEIENGTVTAVSEADVFDG